MHWARECWSKYDIEGKPVSGNSKLGTPQVPINKNQGQTPSFPSNPQHLASAAVDTPALNDFLLFPKVVPSRIPTRLFGPLPPQTFSLLLGWSSLTSKGIVVHPGVIDSDYKGKHSNYDVISDTMAIQKGEQNCSITSFTLHFY